MNNLIPLKENQDSKCPNCNSDQLEKEKDFEEETGWIVCNNCRLRFLEETER